MAAIINNSSTSTQIAQPDQEEPREKILWLVNKPQFMINWGKKKSTPIGTNEGSIQVFGSVGVVDKKLLWIFEMVSSLSVILLAAGLITSQTNVQTHGDILSNHQWAQYAWAWTQNIAIDTSLLGSIIRAGVYWMEREHRKAILYSALSLVLLFTAFIVSNVEALYQSVHGLTLDTAWSHIPFVNVETLTSVRSFAIVLLLIAHAVQYVGWYAAKYRAQKAVSMQSATPVEVPVHNSAIAPMQPEEDKFEKMLNAMQAMNMQNLQAMQAANQQAMRMTVEQISRVTVEIIEDKFASLPASVQVPLIAQESENAMHATDMQSDMHTDKLEAVSVPEKSMSPSSFGDAIAELVAQNPDMTQKDIAAQVGCSVRTVALWKQRMQHMQS